MERTLANELFNQIGHRVLVRGWLNNLRIFGKMSFLLLRDRSGLTQIVIKNKDELEKIKEQLLNVL